MSEFRSRIKYFCDKKGYCRHQSWTGKCRCHDEKCPDCRVVDYGKKLRVFVTPERLPRVVADVCVEYPITLEEEETE